MYRKDKERATSERILLHFDFSENATCPYENEVQSAHWSQKQVSLFVVCVFKSNDALNCRVMVSDDLDHSKRSVSHLQTVVESVITSNVQELIFWSDGPASQFNNRYTTMLLNHFAKKQAYRLQISWNFFATANEKGCVDGVGGSAKQMVWDCVRQRRYQVHSAQQFVTCLNECNSKIVGTVVSSSDIDSTYHQLQEILENIQRCLVFRQIISGQPKTTSSQFDGHSQINYSNCDPTPITNEFRVGDIVVARVSSSRGASKKFVGIIQSYADNDYEVQFLKEYSQSIYTIYNPNDGAWVQKSHIQTNEVDYTIDNRDRCIFSSSPK